MTNAATFAGHCPGCFSGKGDASICPQCGYDESLKRGPLVLPHRTLLHHGQYLIGKVLGKPGGFGITYLALDTKLQTRVAIKEYLPRDLAGRDAGHATISAHSAEDGEFFRYGLTQFLQEARTLAQFDHANIVRVRNFFEENGTGYLVMDYYDGITLAEYLAQQPQGKLPEKTAVGILMPILDGLREVHAKNILHRDIKPQNIYLTTGNRPILLDFGAARQAMGERSRSLSVVLSEGYAPYEEYHRRGDQGPWTDIYACAAVLYHAVSGEAPPPATERMHKDELDIAALGVSAALAEALRSGLATDHHKRPQRMTEFQALLLGEKASSQAAVEHKPVLADIPATATTGGNTTSSAEAMQGKKPGGLKKWWIPALAVVVVIAVVATGSKEEKSTVPIVDAPVPVEPVAKAEQDKAPTAAMPAPAAPEAKMQPDKAPPSAPAAPVASGSEDAEAALWKSVENSTNIESYNSYLKQYPKGKYVKLAKSVIKKLQDKAAARQAEPLRAETEQKEQSIWESATQQYVISTDGTEVADKTRGLIWRRCAEGMEYSGGTCTGTASEFTYNDALQHAAAQASRTGKAWRVPNLDELFSISDKNFGSPTIDTIAFPATPSLYFWSASAYATHSDYAWYVNFNVGSASYGYRGSAFRIRLVRAGQ